MEIVILMIAVLALLSILISSALDMCDKAFYEMDSRKRRISSLSYNG